MNRVVITAAMIATLGASPMSVRATDTSGRVETVKGDVYLRGKVDSEEAKSAAGEIAQGIRGVWTVQNDLQVVPPPERKAVDTSDTAIAKAVRARFARDAQLQNRRPQ